MPLPLLLALAPATQPPRFDPLVFFAGSTEGVGDLKIALHGARSIAVHGHGALDPGGTLVLDQIVEQPGKPAHRRTWRIRRVGPGRYAGTLTDVVGPVAGEATGSRLHLAFRMKGHLAVEQWLTLGPDGRSARNRMTVRLHGLPVAQLDETIRRTGG